MKGKDWIKGLVTQKRERERERELSVTLDVGQQKLTVSSLMGMLWGSYARTKKLSASICKA